MEISDQELRVLVRDAIVRHGRSASAAPDGARPDTPGVPGTPGIFDRMHASHVRLPLAGGSDGDGLCLIEPAVRCNHCGYCQSFGH
jgi:hypothetical protein